MALPANYSVVPVFGRYIDFTGAPMQGTVTFTPSQRYVTNPGADVLIFSAPLVATLDETGAFSIDIPATDDPDVTPQGFTWTVTEAFNRKGGRSPFSISVPEGTPDPGIDLVTVAPVLPADQVSYIVTSVDGMTGTVDLAGKYAPLDEDGKVPVENIPSISGGVTSVNGASGIVSLGAADVGALPVTGGTMQGPLNLAEDPEDPTQASTKAYVDSAVSGLLSASGGTVSGDMSVTGRLTVGGMALPLLTPTTRRPPWRPPLQILTNFQTGHGWTTSGQVGSSDLNDGTDCIKGTQAVRVTTNGAGGGGANLQWLGMPSLDLTEKALRITLKVDDVTTLQELNFLVGTNDSFSNSFKWQTLAKTSTSKIYKSGEWTVITLGWSDVHSGSGTFSLSSARIPSATSGLTRARFQIIDTGAPVTVHVQSVEIIDNITATFPNGVVSITFDDSWASQYTLARPKMDQYGFRGTQYTIASSVGASNRLTLSQLRTFQDQLGWEVAGHAMTQANHDARYNSLTAAQVDDELRNLRAWLVSNGFGGDSFAYPGGQFENTTDGVSIEKLTSRYFSTGRTVLSGYGAATNSLLEQWPPARPYRMLSLSSISSASGGQGLPASLTATGGELDTCKSLGSWLIMTFHVITTGSPEGDDGVITQADFNTVMDAIASRGIPVLPVGDVLRLYS